METSRGCPHGCEFCLASLDKKVRRFPPEAIHEAMDKLWQRGARSFKFVDRSLDARTAETVLGFFAPLAAQRPFIHLELVPDRMPSNLLDLLAPFEPGCVQLEAGVQTFNPEIAARIGRIQDPDVVEANLRTLLRTTGAHIHADLVAGLPGEDMKSFAAGFDRLSAIGVHEIQVGILKRLRGAPIARHDREWDMRYNPRPPYEILSTGQVTYPEMQGLKRFSRYFDMVCNSGVFTPLVP